MTIVGNLTADPELKFGNSGKTYARLRLAESRGEGKESNFYNVTVFEGSAENAVDSLHKGDRVIVQGYFDGARIYSANEESRVALDFIAQEIAPSLRFATVSITRNPRDTASSGVASTNYQTEEEPF
jgi:single-strand DNA-binding protein